MDCALNDMSVEGSPGVKINPERHIPAQNQCEYQQEKRFSYRDIPPRGYSIDRNAQISVSKSAYSYCYARHHNQYIYCNDVSGGIREDETSVLGNYEDNE